jgi:alditol oxidase
VTSLRTNWAGNVAFAASSLASPASVDELQTLVARGGPVRTLGSAHSFNDLADTTGLLISIASLPEEIELDSAAGTVRVAAGVRYASLVRRVHQAGFALPNLGSLPHISVAGACATATHGSGVANGNLATSVRGMDLVTADGDLVTLEPDLLDGAAVHLGCLGVVVGVTLGLVPAFDMRQYVFEGLPLSVLSDHFEELVSSAYSVSLFTDWRAPRITQVWIKARTVDPEPSVFGASWFSATPADGPRHPVPGMPADNCTVQLGVPGPWFERLPHFRADSPPSSAGDELQSEYLLPRDHSVAALHALDRVRDRISSVLQICEIRTIAADELWMSPSYVRDTVALHFTWVSDVAAVRPVVALVEEALAAYEPRPHWGKLFSIPPEHVQRQYQRLPDFRRLMRRYDPAGRFRNAYTDRYLAGD